MDSAFTTPSTTDFSDHSVWRLLLIVATDSLSSVFFNTATRQIVPYSHKSWPADEGSILKHIEDAVYENPDILDDYTTTILIKPDFWCLAPSEIADADNEENLTALMHRGCPTDNSELLLDRAGSETYMCTIPVGLQSFLSRTFNVDKTLHFMHPMKDYTTKPAQRDKGDKVWIDIYKHQLYMCGWKEGQLQICSTWNFRTPEDAAYYIIYASINSKIDLQSGEVMVSGLPEMRAAILPLLRQHASYVATTILPSYMKKSVDSGLPLSVVAACCNEMQHSAKNQK